MQGLFTSRRADTPLSGTWVRQQGPRGAWSWQGGGGEGGWGDEASGSVIWLLVEKEAGAPRTEERQIPVGQQPFTPLGVEWDWWDVSIRNTLTPAPGDV